MLQYQPKLYDILNKLNADIFPNTLLLLGDKGCGKHTFINDIANKLGLEVHNITKDISPEFITECYIEPNPYIYIIDLNDVELEKHNAILKFIEEPIPTSFIILTLELKSQTLPTILNRCQCWEFEKYTEEQLQTFITNEADLLLIDLCTTPGQILSAQQFDYNAINNYSKTIFEKIHKANISNILYSLHSKLAYDNEQDKFDVMLFTKCLLLQLKQLIINQRLPLFNCYDLTNQLYNDLYIPHINRKYLYERYFILLHKLMKEYYGNINAQN